MIHDSEDTNVYLKFKDVIDMKWFQVKVFLKIIGCIYLVLDFFFTLSIFLENSLFYQIPALILNVILIIIHIKTALFDLKSHFEKRFKFFDCFILHLVLLINLYNIFVNKSYQSHIANFYAVLALNSRIVIEFRLISKLRHLIKTIS